MSKTKHTPTPWRVRSAGNTGRFIIESEAGIDLAVTTVPRCNAGKDAAFIVLAANCHDELVAVLKSLQHADGCYCDAAFAMPGQNPSHSPECVAARAALAKATGGES